MTVAKKLRLLAELAETGEEFLLYGDKYRFVNGVMSFEEDGAVIASKLTMFDLKGTDLIQLPFKPRQGETYYCINPWRKCGYSKERNFSTDFDEVFLSRETVYRTEAEVQEVVRKLGWEV